MSAPAPSRNPHMLLWLIAVVLAIVVYFQQRQIDALRQRADSFESSDKWVHKARLVIGVNPDAYREDRR